MKILSCIQLVMAGRPADSVWKNFVQVKDDGKTVAQCLSCNSSVSARPQRMKDHLAKCCKKASTSSTILDIMVRIIQLLHF